MKVLYATDGFPPADDAKRVLMKLFRRDHVKVAVVTVTHSWSFDPDHLLVELEPIAERRGESQDIVRFAAKYLEEAGFDTHTMVLEGHPGHEIVRLAKEGGYDIVILGAGSHSWLGNRLLGSVSTFLLHEAPCSVVVVHEVLSNEGMGRVLVGVDGSKTSDETVKTLARVLDPHRCEVEVLSVVGLQVPVVSPTLIGVLPLDEKLMARQDEILVSRADGYVHRAAGTFRDAGFATTLRVERGGATSVLLQEAHEAKADLVAVGSRGLGPVRRTFLGSVSDHVARHAAAAFVGRFWIDRTSP